MGLRRNEGALRKRLCVVPSLVPSFLRLGRNVSSLFGKISIAISIYSMYQSMTASMTASMDSFDVWFERGIIKNITDASSPAVTRFTLQAHEVFCV